MTTRIVLCLLTASALGGCMRVKVDPVEVKPITLNVNLKIDRDLDEMFDAQPPAATQSAAGSPVN